jgi:hypothetical protein
MRKVSYRKDQNLCIVILNILAHKFYDFLLCVCVCVWGGGGWMDEATVQKGESSGHATPHVVITDSSASNLTLAGESDTVILYS